MSLEASSTSWTHPRSVHTHGAPFAGLDDLSNPTPSSGAFAGAGEGVALVVLGLAALALWYGVREGSRRSRGLQGLSGAREFKNWWESGSRDFEFKTKGKGSTYWKGRYSDLPDRSGEVFVKGPGHGQWTHITKVERLQGLSGARRINQKDYTHYVVVLRGPDRTPVIESGWEYKSDAADQAKELTASDLVLPLPAKVYSKKFLKSQGIDPDDDSNWRFDQLKKMYGGSRGLQGLSGARGLEYRGTSIQKVDAVQVGYRIHEGRHPGKGRKISVYEITLPDGYVKTVDTLKDAKAYVDSYFGGSE